MIKENLLLITRSFPYELSDLFLENELPFLISNFQQVYILPELIDPSFVRAVPSNVIILESLSVAYKRRFSFSLLHAIMSFSYFFIKNLGWSKLRYLKNHFLYAHRLFFFFEREYYKRNILRQIIRQYRLDKNRTLYYCYWFHRSALALALLKHSGDLKFFVSRIHGIDLYDERWEMKMVPFRGFILSQIDKLFPVSEFSKRYLSNRIITSQAKKVSVSRLGVLRHNMFIKNRPDDMAHFRIITVANLFPLKRVHEIPLMLKKIANKKIRWDHFGDGLMKDQLFSNVKALPPNIEFTFYGSSENENILSFYKENYLDLFLSISLSEGLPVSIMEAGSFGIPVLAVNVGGVPEIVNPITGKLIDPSSDYQAIAESLDKMLDGICEFDRYEIKEFIDKNYSCEINYKLFIDNLKRIVEEQ